MKTAALVGVFLALLVVGGLQLESRAREAVDQDAESESPAILAARAKAAEDMLEAAKKTYEATAAGYDAGTAPLADLFIWSRHWLQAEQKLAKAKAERQAALLGHWQRMKKTNEKVAALYRAGSKGGELERYFATKFYLAEAELWLAEAGMLAPQQAN